MKPPAPDLGRAVRPLRRTQDLNQTGLSRIPGVNRVTVAKLDPGWPVSLLPALRTLLLPDSAITITPGHRNSPDTDLDSTHQRQGESDELV